MDIKLIQKRIHKSHNTYRMTQELQNEQYDTTNIYVNSFNDTCCSIMDDLTGKLEQCSINELKVLPDEPEELKELLDISGQDIEEIYKQSPLKKWIKLVLKKDTVPFDEYKRRNDFIKVADIVLDNEINLTGKKEGHKKRNTVIQFVPVIGADEYNNKNEWLYIFLINKRIVKIGGTRVGIKGRVMSYMCGHHIPERGKSGDCSKTNGFIYNTFDFYLQLGCTIEMYGYPLPRTELEITIFDRIIKVVAQTYHAYESTFLDDYKKQYYNYPVLCDNCDPDYKEKEKDGEKGKEKDKDGMKEKEKEIDNCL